MSGSREREKNILRAIVQEYILTAEPVSSKALAAKYTLGLSPATIRNIMAELENEGYLYQPHTSAGRVPTEKSFRFYVDSLVEPEEPDTGAKDFIRKSFDRAHTTDGLLLEAARVLSAITNCAGLMFIPGRDRFVIRHISLLPIAPSEIMVVLVSKTGLVETRRVRLEDGARLDIERISNYLNSIAGGLTLRELRARIVEEMKKEKTLYDELLSRALKLGAMALEEAGGREDGLYLEGRLNILDQPEFRDDFERMKRIFAAFEEKSLLVRILDRSIEEGGMRIYLGSESTVEEFKGLSFVTAPYGGEGVLGTLGVVGPVRMDYRRIIPLVEYTAGLLSKDL